MSEISTLERFMQESLPKRHIAPQFMHRLSNGELTLDAPAHKAKLAVIQATIWDLRTSRAPWSPTRYQDSSTSFFQS